MLIEIAESLLEATADKHVTKEDIERFFGPILKQHRDYITDYVTDMYTKKRKAYLKQFPNSNIKYAKVKDWAQKNDYPDDKDWAMYLDNKSNNVKTAVNWKDEDRYEKEHEMKDSKGHWAFCQLFGYGKDIYDDERFIQKVNEIVKDTIEGNEFKLIRAFILKLDGLDIKSVKEIDSNIGKQGIEGTFGITLTNGKKGNLATQSIFAGGYNIQKLHYRYLMKLSKELETDKVEIVDALTPSELEVIKIMKALIATGFDIKEKIPRDPKVAVESLKGASRNWGPWVKKGYIWPKEEGRYYVKRFNYFISPAGQKWFSEFEFPKV